MALGSTITRISGAGALALTLSGCMSPEVADFFGQSPLVTRTDTMGHFEVAQSERAEEHHSEIIDLLISRYSILPRGSSYARVADGVIAGAARTAESELLQARLRSKSADKNWLPRLGPNVSLTSLSSFVASMVLDQVLFDNGRRAAERDFARADVEAAAVNLSIEQNDRVHQGLTLYIAAEEARAQAKALEGTLREMRELDRIMTARVAGGISDRSEGNLITAKVSDLNAAYQKALRDERTAMAELAAMSPKALGNLRGVASLNIRRSGTDTLKLIHARAVETRDIAKAAMDRAAMLPGAAASVKIGDGGGAGVRMTSDQGFGFGTFDAMRALDVAKETAARRTNDEAGDSARRLAALREKHAAMRARSAEAAALAKRARSDTTLAEKQFRAGTRTALEIAGVYENLARLDETAISARYEMARIEIEIAREMGLLAEGSKL